jgi:hypothetical protein
MAKKNTLLTVAIIGVGAYLVLTAMRKKRGVTVTAENPIKQSESEYAADYADVVSTTPAPTVLEKATSIFKTIFPAKTAEQKAAKAAKKATKKTTKAAKKATRKAKVKGFDDLNVLY